MWMTITSKENFEVNIEALNENIKLLSQVYLITDDMISTYKGVSRLVMLDRYAFKDTEKKTGIIKRGLGVIDKSLEVYYEQIAKRNANDLASVETSDKDKQIWSAAFNKKLVHMNFISAGRVLYRTGAVLFIQLL